MKNIALLAPLIIIGLALLIVSLIDLYRRPHVRGGNKWVWLGVILVLGTLGQIAYLLFGREDT